MMVLGEIQGVIRPFHQQLQGIAHVGEGRKADRGRDLGPARRELDRLLQHCGDRLAGRPKAVLVGSSPQDEGIFVAAEAGKFRRNAEHGDEAAGDLLQDEVARRMPVDVVDRFEPVEIDEPKGEAAILLLRVEDDLLQVAEEAAPIRQARQAIEVGVAEILVAQGCEVGPRRDEIPELLEIVGQQDVHDDRDEREIERDRHQDHVPRQEEPEQERHRHGHGQQER